MRLSREKPETFPEGDFLDKTTVAAGFLLALTGLTGLVYGAGINFQGMMARGVTDCSFIAA
jgi:hypothetical protein